MARRARTTATTHIEQAKCQSCPWESDATNIDPAVQRHLDDEPGHHVATIATSVTVTESWHESTEMNSPGTPVE